MEKVNDVKIIFAFAGQGSQFYGMGRMLYESNVTFRETVDEIDQQMEEILGLRIKDIMFGRFNERTEKFDDIITSSLAIFAFEYAAAIMLLQEGIQPDGVVGCSLGEFSAAVFSKVIDLKTGIQLIYDQTKLIEQNVLPGGMLTIGADYNVLKNYVEKVNCSLVSINHNKHFVVSGDEKSILLLEKKLEDEKIVYVRLPVKYGFHSYCIEGIKTKFDKLVKEVEFRSPQYTFYSCVYGKRITRIDGQYLWKVLREPIQWRKTILRLTKTETIIIDLSADAELASMIRYINPNNKNVYKISSAFNTKIDIRKVINKIKREGEKKMKAIVFPGQGSQYEGMGKAVFDEFPDLVKKANELLGYSIEDLCINNPNGILNQTEYTQPALYVICTLSYLKLLKDGEKEPDYVAGHSVGEYSALFASGVVDFETGLKLVQARGKMMAKMAGGGMAAVLGLKEEQVRYILRENDFTEIDVANLNAPTQIVISGSKEDILAAEDIFREHEGCFMYKVLNVSGAFHSRYMKPVVEEFTQLLKTATFHKMKIPIIANLTAHPYDENKVVEILSKQLVSSVHWTDSIRYMIAKGVKEFIEVGPGNVLQKLIVNIKRESEPLDLEKLSNEPTEFTQISIEKSEEKPKVFKLGSVEFKDEYHTKYAYVIGAMGYGISNEQMVISAGKNGLLSFFGTAGLELTRVEQAIKRIQQELQANEPYGFNLTFRVASSEMEEALIKMYLAYGVHTIEASAFTTVTKQLVYYRIKGIRKNMQGNVEIPNRIIVKLSHTDIAESFMSPPPKRIVDVLLHEGDITQEEAELSQLIPMAHDICVVTDTAGYTDRANMFALLPAIRLIRDRICNYYQYSSNIRVGAAGCIGSPDSAATVFLMGADFILTGSINQCTVEAGTSDTVKDLLSGMNVQDTSYIRTIGGYDTYQQMQVLKKGTLFYVCAEKFYDLYHRVNSIEEIDDKTRELLETRYLKRSFQEVLYEIEPNEELEVSYNTSKIQLKLVFEWYLKKAFNWAIEGDTNNQINYGIMCSAALGAFNQWVKGTTMEDWRNRTVVTISEKLMEETASLYMKKLGHEIVN